MTIGIYYIEVNNKYYIGQSVNIENRFKEHKRTLCKNEHFNYKLQQAYNEYPNTLSMGILETCTLESIDNLESTYVNEFNATVEGYNIAPGGIMGNRYGENHPYAKFSNAQVLETIKLLSEGNLTMVAISNITGVSKAMVSRITTGIAHVWAQDIVPDEYKKMLSINRQKIACTTREAVIKIKPFYLENKSLGIIEKVTVIADFTRKYGIFSSRNSISKLRSSARECKSIKGWTLYTGPILEGTTL